MPAPKGFDIWVQEFDFGTAFAICLVREDGLRKAVRYRPDRLWRRTDGAAQEMLAKLLAWFDHLNT